MPREIELQIFRSCRRAHSDYSRERCWRYTYATMNKMGLLHSQGGKRKTTNKKHK